MKVILLTGGVPEVLTVVEHDTIQSLDNVWCAWVERKIAEQPMKILVVGNKIPGVDKSADCINYTGSVEVTAYCAYTNVPRYNNRSPIIEDVYTDEYRGDFNETYVSRELLDVMGYDSNSYSVEEMRQMAKAIQSNLGDTDALGNAIETVISHLFRKE